MKYFPDIFAKVNMLFQAAFPPKGRKYRPVPSYHFLRFYLIDDGQITN
jgi:hypothetical protein